MTAGLIQQEFLATPDVEGLQGTLLDAASVVDMGGQWTQLRGMYESYNCLDLAVPTTLCGPTSTKTFGSMAWPDGIRFAVQGGVQCKAIGYDSEGSVPEITRVFELRESIAVERALMQTRFIAGPDLDPGVGVNLQWAAPVDITPASGAVTPKVALALLEGHAGSKYAGVPTIHVPRTIGSLLIDGGTIGWEGSTLRSGLKSKVSSGAGYDYPNNGPAGAAPAAGELWAYASGEVSVIRHGLITPAPQMDRGDNTIYTLVERAYTISVDCYVAAIRVKVA